MEMIGTPDGDIPMARVIRIVHRDDRKPDEYRLRIEYEAAGDEVRVTYADSFPDHADYVPALPGYHVVERRACEIRLRAERKAGQLLAKMEKAKSGPGLGKKTAKGRRSFTEYGKAIASNKIPGSTARRFQQLAKVPEDEFETALAAPKKPSTKGIKR